MFAPLFLVELGANGSVKHNCPRLEPKRGQIVFLQMTVSGSHWDIVIMQLTKSQNGRPQFAERQF